MQKAHKMIHQELVLSFQFLQQKFGHNLVWQFQLYYQTNDEETFDERIITQKIFDFLIRSISLYLHHNRLSVIKDCHLFRVKWNEIISSFEQNRCMKKCHSKMPLSLTLDEKNVVLVHFLSLLGKQFYGLRLLSSGRSTHVTK